MSLPRDTGFEIRGYDMLDDIVRVVLCVVLLVQIMLMACVDSDGCVDKTGNAYTCTCTRRCNGVTESWSTSYTCYTDGSPTSDATRRCESSCSPQATCTSCTCTAGSSCEVVDYCGH